MTSTLHMGQWVLLPGIIPVTEVYLELAVSAPAALWGLQMKKKSLEQGFGHLPQMLLLREWLGPSRHSWEIQKQNEEILCEKKKKKTSLVQELQKTRGNGHVGEQWHLRRCLADLHVSEPTKK